MAADHLIKSYDTASGLVAFALALYTAYLMIEIVRRIRDSDRDLAMGWLLGGSLCVGTGIWAEHSVGLLSLELPIPIGFNATLALVSWFPIVVSIGIVLALMSQPHLKLSLRLVGATVLSVGLCTMHYLGMASLRLQPGIVWDLGTIAGAGVLAFVGMAAGSAILRYALDSPQPLTQTRMVLAAVPCALGLRAIQYVALSGASFPVGSVSMTTGQLSGSALGGMATVATVLLFAAVQLSAVLDRRLRQQQAHLAHSLEDVHHALEDSAHRDALTGLQNRLGVERHLNGLFQRTSATQAPFALMFINLDGFKLVNESLGHDQGDALLKQAATRLGELIRRDDVVSRVAADEFLILLDGQITIDVANVLAQRVSAALSQAFVIGSHELTLSCSMGIALRDSASQANELIANAEAAMRNAKSAGGGTHCFYDKGMSVSNAAQIDLQRDLRLAVNRQELMLYYQPKRHARTGRSCGVEALLRWKHPTRGMVSPAEFIPLAERFGLISALGAWVIEEACQQIKDWRGRGLRVQVAVNLSVHQLRNPDLESRIREAIARHQVEPALLIFEITESVAMENVEATMAVFEKLASIGVQLSIDDFGTGYSSLSYLSRLPASQLKIDRSFVKDLDHDKNAKNARAIVEAVIQLSHALDLRVVAEGVETEAQHQVLLDLHCDELQGFLFAKPMPPEAFEQWMEAQQASTAAETDSMLAELT
ncbi:MAG: EAL domain-containing protein [Rubrivivax sp.]|nr:MAG: EAL domain-containing protein [Rubrivivax sp.]